MSELPQKQPQVPDSIGPLLDGASRHRSRAAIVAAVVGALVASLGVLSLVKLGRPPQVLSATLDGDVVRVTQEASGGVLWMSVSIAVMIVLGAVFAILRAKQRGHPAAVLGGTVELDAVGRFAEALWHAEGYVRTEAEEVLITLLPRLKASDAGLLSPAQRGCLHRALKAPRRRREADLVVAIIGALVQIGDERAIPHVERLAEEPARTQAQSQVRAFAAEQLPVLRERIEAARQARTLVRPASGGDEALVRPASGGPGGPVEQLVRPADASNDQYSRSRPRGLR